MSPAKELAGRRVLIVEDRYLIASEIADEVRNLGGEVLGPVANLEAASEIVREGRADLALLDVDLDGELVFPVAEELARRDAPFAFLTGYDEQTLPEAWRGRPRLVKPVHPKLLREELLRLVGAKP